MLASKSLFAQSTTPEALKSVDGIVNELLNLLSGEIGEKRDLKAIRNLFLPTATFNVLMHESESPQTLETINLDDFLALLKDEYYEQGFEERELSKVVDEYNGIAQVFQTFYAKDSEGEEGRGINCYQLAYFQDRWWIVNLLWTGEDNGVKIPARYLNDEDK